MKSLLKKRKFKLFNTLTILFIIIVFFGILSLILSYFNVMTTKSYMKDGKIIKEEIPILGAGLLQWLVTIPLGLQNSTVISIFLFIFGSFMYLTIKTKALNAVVLKFLNKATFKESEKINFETNFLKKNWFEIKNMFKTTWIIIPVMLFLSLNGTFNGMGTSSLPLYAFVVPIFLAAGFDIWTAFLIVFVGAGSGVIGSTVNPFATIIATDVAYKAIESGGVKENLITIVDGMVWRWVSWIVIFLISTLFVMFYGYRVKKNKKNSYFYDKFDYYKNEFDIDQIKNSENVLTKRKIMITILFFLSFFLMLFLVIPYDEMSNNQLFENLETKSFNNVKSFSWFNNSAVTMSMFNSNVSAFQFGKWNLLALATYFMVASIFIAILAKFSEEKFIETITKGFQKMIPAILCIGMASGLSVLFAGTNLKHLFINGIVRNFDSKQGLGGNKFFSVPILTFILTIPVSLLIPSTSGLAKAMFPILGPALHKIQEQDQVLNNSYISSSITSYTFGIGIGNLFAPTYAAVVVSTAFCKIKYNKFLKHIWKYLLLIFIVCFILIIIGGLINNKTNPITLNNKKIPSIF